MQCVQKRVQAAKRDRSAPFIPSLIHRREIGRLQKQLDRLNAQEREKMVAYLLDCAPKVCRWLVGEYLGSVAGH